LAIVSDAVVSAAVMAAAVMAVMAAVAMAGVDALSGASKESPRADRANTFISMARNHGLPKIYGISASKCSVRRLPLCIHSEPLVPVCRAILCFKAAHLRAKACPLPITFNSCSSVAP
jgi:hypothetical protein